MNSAIRVETPTIDPMTDTRISMREVSSDSPDRRYTVPTRSPSSTIGWTTTSESAANRVPGADGVAGTEASSCPSLR